MFRLFNKSKLSNGTNRFLELKFLFIVKFKKLGFSAPLRVKPCIAKKFVQLTEKQLNKIIQIQTF